MSRSDPYLFVPRTIRKLQLYYYTTAATNTADTAATGSSGTAGSGTFKR